MKSKTWTTEELNFIVSNLHLNTIDIYQAFIDEYSDRSYDSVQKKVKQLRNASISDDESYTQQADGYTEDMLDQIEDTLVGLGIPGLDIDYGPSQSTQTLTAPPQVTPLQVKQNTQAFIEQIREMTEGLDFSLQAPGVNSNKPSLIVCLTDLHFGKKTAKFNMKEGAMRLETLPARIVEQGITEDTVDEVVLLVGGDVVEGEDIYANQNGVLECSVIEQARAACEAIWKCAINFQSTFKCKVRLETSPGNHGRMSKTANTDSNWDNVVSMMLGLVANGSGNNNISVNVNFDFFNFFEVKGHKGLLYHYGVKHLGTPAGAIKIAGWILSDKIDFLVHGHWHKWGIGTYLGRPMISNGSLPGPDDLSKSMAMEEPARQGYFMVAKDKPPYGFSFVEWS